MADAPEVRMLVVVTRDDGTLDEIVTGMLDADLDDPVVVEGKGIEAILRQDMPIFCGLATLLPNRASCRVIVSRATDVQIARLKRFLEEMSPERRPRMIVVPTLEVW